MNIRYRFRNRETGSIHSEIFSLEEIERIHVTDMVERNGYEILSRDWGTGLKDRKQVEAFDRDQLKDLVNGIVYTVYWDKTQWALSYLDRKYVRVLMGLDMNRIEIIGRE